MEFLIYSPKSKVAQEGIISSLDLEAPARNDGCPQGKVVQEGIPSPPAGINLLLNTQRLPDRASYLVFPVGAYVSYPP